MSETYSTGFIKMSSEQTEPELQREISSFLHRKKNRVVLCRLTYFEYYSHNNAFEIVSGIIYSFFHPISSSH